MAITIGVCTSSYEYNIKALLSKLKSSLPMITVKMVPLPYNDLDSYAVEREGLDGLILCHSIMNRRFAITDVSDALYDKFLKRAKKYLGKENVVVIAHDFSLPFSKNASMVNQPTAVDCSSLVILCGKLETTVQMDEDDWNMLVAHAKAVQPIKHVHPLYELTLGLYNGLQSAMSLFLYIIIFVLTILWARLWGKKKRERTGTAMACMTAGHLDSVQSHKVPDEERKGEKKRGREM